MISNPNYSRPLLLLLLLLDPTRADLDCEHLVPFLLPDSNPLIPCHYYTSHAIHDARLLIHLPSVLMYCTDVPLLVGADGFYCAKHHTEKVRSILFPMNFMIEYSITMLM